MTATAPDAPPVASDESGTGQVVEVNVGVIDENNTLRFFVDDGDEESAGAVARLRLFDTALSAAEVRALYHPTTSPAPALAPGCWP